MSTWFSMISRLLRPLPGFVKGPYEGAPMSHDASMHSSCRPNPCGYITDTNPEKQIWKGNVAEPGNTPMIEVEGVFAKLECVNPCNSIKDRIARYIIEESERRGILQPGMRIVEATSGNTGIAMSYYAARKGYRCTIVMPQNMSEERKQIIRSMGADLVLCAPGDFAGAAAIRDEMAAKPGHFNPDQFSNPLNIECHYRTTGQELLRQLAAEGRQIEAFVAGVGTGGTLIGVGKAIREVFPNAHIVAVEPTESAVMSGGEAGVHGIQGIGDGFIPAIAGDGKGGLHPMINEVICVSTEEARNAAYYVQETYGHCVGISSGANFLAAKKLQSRFKTVATVFADGYSKYQSHGLKHCGKGRCKYEDPARTVFAYHKEPSK
jgi:cysteine synthase A